MHLFINNYGVKIEIEDDRFKISDGDNVRYASPLKLSSICFLKHCTVTTAALELAATHEVPVMIMNETGDVTAWLWSPRYGTIADVRVKQAFFCRSKEALRWIQKMINTKMQEQAAVLNWMATRVIAEEKPLQKAERLIKDQREALPHTLTMQHLMGLEAMASRKYWDAIALSLKKYVEVPGRVKRGATDAFNVCLNYLYGILYGQVESSLLMAGADPYMGFMHINRHARPALAFDHIEPFRPWVDKLVIQLFMQNKAMADCLEQTSDNEKRYINSDAKKLLINTYFFFMEQKSYLAGKRIKNADHIHYLSRELVKTLKNFNAHDTAAHNI